MDISFITLNRIVEERAAVDEHVRQALEKTGRVLLSHGRAMSDEALLAKLRLLNLSLDKSQFLARSQRFLSAQEMAQALYKERGSALKGSDEDWIWIAFTCLWERWQPDRLSLEMIDDRMQEGYKAQKRRDFAGACRLWLEVWNGIWKLIEALQLRSVKEFDDRFPLTNCLFNWVQDFLDELHNAGLDDLSFLKTRLAVIKTLLTRLEPDPSLLSHFRSDLAETSFALGDPEKGDQMYREWLHEEPQWGWGWIRWSDCYYHFAADERKDPARAEQILKEGLAVDGVQDRAYLLDRLADLYSETGREEEAGALRAEIEELKKPTVPVRAKPAGEHLPIKQTVSFGEPGLPLRELGRLRESLRGTMPSPATGKGKVGRNDPCPCGSGKKFKRCCGKNTA